MKTTNAKIEKRVPKESADLAEAGLKKKRAAKAEGREADLDAETEAHVANVLVMLEIGFLAALADGGVDDAEFNELGHNFAQWAGFEVDAEYLTDQLQAFADLVEREGFDARVTDTAKRLPADARQTAFAFAALIVASNGEIEESELVVLQQIGDALGIEESAAQAMFDDVVKQVEESQDPGRVE